MAQQETYKINVESNAAEVTKEVEDAVKDLKESVDSVGDSATSSLDKLGDSAKKAEGNVESASKGMKNLADSGVDAKEGVDGAVTVLDQFTGGMAGMITNVARGFKAFGKQAVTAFKAATAGASGMRKALIATGIGAIIAAVGTLIAYWEDLVGWFGFGADETKKLTEAQEAYNTALAGAQGAADANAISLGIYLKAVQDVTAAEEDRLFALNKLKEAGIITEDIDLANAESLGILNKRVEDNIKLTYARAQANAASQYLEKEMIKLYELQSEQAEQRKEAYELAAVMQDDFIVGGMAEYVLNEGLKKQNEELLQQDANILRAKESYKEALEALMPLEGENLQLQEDTREELKRRAETDAAVAQALKDRQAAEEKAAAAYEEVLRQARKTQEDEEIALMESMALALDTLYQGQLTAKEQELNAIADKYYQLEQYYADDAETAKYIEEAKQKDLQAIQDRYRDEQLKADKELETAKQKLALDGLGALNAIAQAALEGNDKRAKLAFRINKALSLSQAIMSTSQAVTAALAQTTDPSPTQSLRFANAALAGAQGLAQIIAISRQQFNPEAGGAAGGSGSVPRPSASRPTLRFDAQGINSSIGLDQSPNLGNQIAESLTGNPIKAYVVSQEVQTQAKMNRKIRETATIG